MAVVLFVGAEGNPVQLLAQVPLGPIVTGIVARRPRERGAGTQLHVRGALLPVKPVADGPAGQVRPAPSGSRSDSSNRFGTIENTLQGVR